MLFRLLIALVLITTRLEVLNDSSAAVLSPGVCKVVMLAALEVLSATRLAIVRLDICADESVANWFVLNILSELEAMPAIWILVNAKTSEVLI